MKEKQKKIGGIFFLILLLLGMIGGILLPDKEISTTERRTLAQFPTTTWDSLSDNGYSELLETYLLEQFPARDIFRMIKTEFDIWVFHKSDSNGYVKEGNQLFQVQTTYDKEQVVLAGELFEQISYTYFPEANVYYALIPDKNYFVDTIPGYEYAYVDKTLADTFSMGIKIDLLQTIELEDYYDTDLHLKQEAVIPLVNELLLQMECDTEIKLSDYEQVLAAESFYGGYSANSAYLSSPDTLYYLDSELLQEAVVHDYEANGIDQVYTLDKLNDMDDYDIFLGGARALLTIENVQVENGKKLLIFRDSFGSSIAPLLLEGYEEITLVDLRYVSASYAMELLMESEEQPYDDVLFLYQVEVLYNSNSMKRN